MNELHKLGITAFIAGASVMVVEILGVRLFAPYFGSSTYVWSALIGVILASLSLGYYLGGRQADLKSSRKQLSLILFLAGCTVVVIPMLSPYVAAVSLLLGYRLGPLLYALILFSIPNVLLGMVPPYAIKLAAKKLVEIGSIAGDLYALSTVGSIVGTLLSGFVLIPLMPVTGIFLGVTLALVAASLLLGTPSKYTVITCIGILLILYYNLGVDAYEMFYPDDRVVYGKYTPYQRIVVLDDEAGKTRRMMLDSSYSGKLDLETNRTVYEYVRFFELPFLFRSNISTVYMIGEGAGVGAIQIRLSHPGTNIVVAEIDPEVHQAAVDYFNFREDNGIEVTIGDGRQAVKQSKGKYDLVIIDAYNSVCSIPTHLTTREFFKELKCHMKPSSILEINVITFLDENRSVFMQSLCRTISLEFEYVYFYPVHSTTDLTRIQNVILIASDQPLQSQDREELKEYRNILFNETQLEEMLSHRINWFACSKGIVLTDDYSPVDYLMEPIMEKSFG